MDVSPKQIVSAAASLIPFLEHDDANRALMGCNMQRQAVPLLRTEAPLVGTGMEEKVARDSGAVVVAKRGGIVETRDRRRHPRAATTVRRDEVIEDFTGLGGLDEYRLHKFQRSNQDTCINQKPLVQAGQKVEKGDRSSPTARRTDNGELALGRNVLVAFMPWGGYNFEDAILCQRAAGARTTSSPRSTSRSSSCQVRDTKRGVEEITREIPNVGEDALRNLDEDGIIRIGAHVQAGDILVGKVTPKGETELSPEERLLRAIFGEKAGDVRDASLKAPPGMDGIVVDVKVFSRQERDDRAKKRGEAADRRVCAGAQRKEKHGSSEMRDERLRRAARRADRATTSIDAETGEVHRPRRAASSRASCSTSIDFDHVHWGLPLVAGRRSRQDRVTRSSRPPAASCETHRRASTRRTSSASRAATSCRRAWSSWSRSTSPASASSRSATRWPAATATRASSPRSCPRRTCRTWPTGRRSTSSSIRWACPAA